MIYKIRDLYNTSFNDALFIVKDCIVTLNCLKYVNNTYKIESETIIRLRESLKALEFIITCLLEYNSFKLLYDTVNDLISIFYVLYKDNISYIDYRSAYISYKTIFSEFITIKEQLNKIIKIKGLNGL